MSGTQTSRPTGGRPKSGEPVLERAFRLLHAFADAPTRSLTLQQLAARADLPKTTTFRLATQLVSLAALERLDNGEFVIGLRMMEIASLGPRGYGLRATALPFMEDLHRITGQHVLLAVRDGNEAVLVERLSARDATTVKYRVGGRLPLDTTGVGVALLAHAPESLRGSFLARLEVDGRTSRLRELLAAVRTEGVCEITGANPAAAQPAAMSTVAAPILTRRGRLLGAISLVAPAAGGSVAANRVALRTVGLAIARTMDAADPG
ncbi:IclR family transcriptional regulator [Microbacterium terregens]|uniref:IclR family transcriptional regulator n=1 Tax=Microbacterium terregens TaxID=69363 RepID=A0ABV5SWL2_9MICO